MSDVGNISSPSTAKRWQLVDCDAAEECLDQAASAPGELGEAVPDRRETNKALYMSLAARLWMSVTHNRGFERGRKLCKEFGSTTGTSLHEYTNLVEYDFGTSDGFKKKLLEWENQIVVNFSGILKCTIVLSKVPSTNQDVSAISESRRLRSFSRSIDEKFGG